MKDLWKNHLFSNVLFATYFIVSIPAFAQEPEESEGLKRFNKHFCPGEYCNRYEHAWQGAMELESQDSRQLFSVHGYTEESEELLIYELIDNGYQIIWREDNFDGMLGGMESVDINNDGVAEILISYGAGNGGFSYNYLLKEVGGKFQSVGVISSDGLKRLSSKNKIFPAIEFLHINSDGVYDILSTMSGRYDFDWPSDLYLATADLNYQEVGKVYNDPFHPYTAFEACKKVALPDYAEPGAYDLILFHPEGHADAFNNVQLQLNGRVLNSRPANTELAAQLLYQDIVFQADNEICLLGDVEKVNELRVFVGEFNKTLFEN